MLQGIVIGAEGTVDLGHGGSRQVERRASSSSMQPRCVWIMLFLLLYLPACGPSQADTRALGILPAAAVAGRWAPSSHTTTIPDPLNGEPFVQLPDTQEAELDHFVASLQACPKSGLHNPLKNPERCGHKAAEGSVSAGGGGTTLQEARG